MIEVFYKGGFTVEKRRKLVKPYLITRTIAPGENQENPIQFVRKWITPKKYFYRRNHFPYHSLPEDALTLPIIGNVKHPLSIPYHELIQMPSKEQNVVMVCSGDKRAFFEPKVFGEQWEKGAVSQGRWKGVPLSHLLKLAKIKSTTKEVVFEGYDNGIKPNFDAKFSFTRSLPIDVAMHPDTLIAYELNDKPIPFKHGYPLRLIVPTWYAMASVKWLKQITVIDGKFHGPYQTDDYVYYPDKTSDQGKHPVTTKNVNSSIQFPLDFQILNQGVYDIEGIAFSGEGEIVKVEVSTDDGNTWHHAKLKADPNEPYSWVFWSITWDVKKTGEYILRSRATDSAGRVQPLTPYWNRKGYGYNAIDKVHVKVE